MDDFPHLAAGSVSENNVKAIKDAIENLTEPSIKENRPTALDKDHNPKASQQKNESSSGTAETEIKNVSKMFEVLKIKSGDVAEICKEDINEIYSTIKEDAANTFLSLKQGFNTFSSSISGKYQKSQSGEGAATVQREAQEAPVTSLFSNLSLFSSKSTIEESANNLSAGIASFFKNAIVIEAPEEVVEQEQKKMFDKKFAKVISLQNDLSTYTTDPNEVENEAELFKGFSLDMDEEDFPEKCFQLLAENPDMKSIFNRLVPNVLSQKDFWTRYYFRAYHLEKAETEKKALIDNALVQDEELFSWDDEDSETEAAPEAKASVSVVDQEAKKDSNSAQPEAIAEEAKSDKDDDDWGQWE